MPIGRFRLDRKSTRLNSSHLGISYAVFCLKKNRVELFELLGTRYYCFAYSSLPILGCYLLAQGIRQRDTLSLLGFAGVSAAILWFDVAMMMKAPAVIYIGTLGLTLGLSGFGVVRRSLVTA